MRKEKGKKIKKEQGKKKKKRKEKMKKERKIQMKFHFFLLILLWREQHQYEEIQFLVLFSFHLYAL